MSIREQSHYFTCVSYCLQMASKYGVLVEIFLVALIFNCSLAGKKDVGRVIKFKVFGDCGKGSPNKIANARIQMFGRGTTVINVDFIVNQPIVEGKFWFTVYKCSTECEKHLKYPTDFCHVLTEKGMPWTQFLDSATPRLKCPVKKGTYQFKNATMDASAVNLGSAFQGWMEAFDWKVVFEIIDKSGTNLACGEVLIGTERVKKKS